MDDFLHSLATGRCGDESAQRKARLGWEARFTGPHDRASAMDTEVALNRFALVACFAPLLLVACTGPAFESGPAMDGGIDSEVADGTYVFPAADGGLITALTLTPLPLVPRFSPDISDYYVRCAAGKNSTTLTITDSAGVHSTSVELVEDQGLVVGDMYWIRCLPHDFPVIDVVAHPEVGSPTPGYYLVNSSNYAIVLDTNGTPLWYTRGTSVVGIDAPEPNTVSLSPNDVGWSNSTQFDVHAFTSLTTTRIVTIGAPTDGHELRRLPNGNWLLFAFVLRNGVDLTGLDAFGSEETVADCVVQEIDAQEHLIWSWIASDHVDPVRESVEPMKGTFNGEPVVDLFHCNSIDVDDSGNLLISFRHANAVFYVDRDSGVVKWKLGGTPYSKDGANLIVVTSDPEGSFNLQHDARFGTNGDVTLFDDHGATSGVARAVEYAIDHDTGTASVVWQFLGPSQSGAEGSFRRYADGHSVIGWGVLQGDPRVLTEVDADGNDVLDVSLAGQVSYRAIKVPLTQLDIGLLRATAAK